MARRVTIIGAVLLVVFVAAVLLPFIAKARHQANVAASQNNLRELSLFAARPANPDPRRAPAKGFTEVPAGTVVVPGVPPEERLSWVVTMLPVLDQRKVNSAQLLAALDTTKPWSFEPNQAAGRVRVPMLLCPENPPEVPPGAAAVTSYVGIGGLGASAAALPLDAPRAGAVRYDAPTPFERITDGISQTLLFAETRNDVGPWLRGGPATVRGLDDAPSAPPLVGAGGQFGGYFSGTANFAMCDGSVRTFTAAVEPRVLFGLSTIAGKDTDPAMID
ncbi:hypothetical protein GobsT_59950 [Gemmata obscuriglobus]|nr:DUF1559 domain-containing protein [Gemmata obscuriglobus]QEG31174.1 hypothetical protein GobsT_59950 [Gemmata obscuriglobus]VTS10512.1 Uncharacterized protein OS=Planctomyces brasiliensis (strain ATCC 49424 / DSM 5305 / JCM 21570 / NBRC 103401 / IFAM 1448) GN=Plabr_4569 PE=4 SV=1: SBP_bac_10 [Gemmata obscuriglobus UQM 2246]